VPVAVRALRGATTVDHDTAAEVDQRVVALLDAMFEQNAISHDDLISVIFTATDDIVSTFPAASARKLGLGDVPLLCARELAVEDSTPRCIRVLMHLTTDRDRHDLHHVYQEQARGLRDDLPN